MKSTETLLVDTRGWGIPRLAGAVAALRALERAGTDVEPHLRQIEDRLEEERRKILNPEPSSFYGPSAMYFGGTAHVHFKRVYPFSRKHAEKIGRYLVHLGYQVAARQIDREHAPGYHRSEWVLEINTAEWTTWADRGDAILPRPSVLGMTEEEASGYVSELMGWDLAPAGHWAQEEMGTFGATDKQMFEDDPASWYVIVKVPALVDTTMNKKHGSVWLTFYDRDELETWTGGVREFRAQLAMEEASSAAAFLAGVSG